MMMVTLSFGSGAKWLIKMGRGWWCLSFEGVDESVMRWDMIKMTSCKNIKL